VATHEGVAGKCGSGIEPTGFDGAMGDWWMFERRGGPGVEGFEMVVLGEAGGVELPTRGLGIGVQSEEVRRGGTAGEEACKKAGYSERDDLEKTTGSPVRFLGEHGGGSGVNLFK